MKHSPDNQQALVNILLRYWQDISAIEQEFGLLVGKGDGRVRIDYFHDAIRAYTSRSGPAARLGIERLAYDVRCLHYLGSQPLASITHDEQHLSPANALITTNEPKIVGSKKRMDRETRLRLGELYEQYGVLFAALLKATADHDYHERTDALDNDVAQLNQLAQALAANAGMQEISGLIAHLDDEAIKREMMALLPQLKGKNASALSGLIARLKAGIQKKDKAARTIDAAHHQYATSQLAIYESARDMLKQMAGQGMNLVGQFVEAAMKEAGRDRGR